MKWMKVTEKEVPGIKTGPKNLPGQLSPRQAV
jgi:hypothetical protein